MIIDIPKFTHLHKNFTVQDIASLAKQAISNIEMESYPLQWHTIRMLYNTAIGELQDTIYLTNKSDYEIIYPVVSEETEYKNLRRIDLGKADFTDFKAYGEVFYTSDNFIPINHIKSIVGLFCASKGSFVERAMEDLISIGASENSLYSQSLLYAKHGDYVYYFTGDIELPDDEKYFLRVIRKVILDDLKHPMPDHVLLLSLPNLVATREWEKYSMTYHSHIDIPEKFVRLLTLQLKKECLEYLLQPIPEELESKIASIIQTLSAGKQLDAVGKQEMKDKIS